MQFTYKDNDKIKYCPEAGEISPETQGKPLKHHLNAEECTEPEVGPVQNVFEHNVLIQIDVFKTERDAGGKDKGEDEPLKHWCVYH